MSQDVEDKIVSFGGVKFKKPKVKEVTENGIRYKVFYTTEYNGNSHNELNELYASSWENDCLLFHFRLL